GACSVSHGSSGWCASKNTAAAAVVTARIWALGLQPMTPLDVRARVTLTNQLLPITSSVAIGQQGMTFRAESNTIPLDVTVGLGSATDQIELSIGLSGMPSSNQVLPIRVVQGACPP